MLLETKLKQREKTRVRLHLLDVRQEAGQRGTFGEQALSNLL